MLQLDQEGSHQQKKGKLRMTPRHRLILCAVMILISASYAVLVAKNLELAKAVALGYIAVMLTLIAIINIWKRA